LPRFPAPITPVHDYGRTTTVGAANDIWGRGTRMVSLSGTEGNKYTPLCQRLTAMLELAKIAGWLFSCGDPWLALRPTLA